MYIKMIEGFLISLVIVLFAMPYLINYLKKISFNQAVSEYSLEEYKEKAKTPTMGGILFILTPIVVTLFVEPSAIKNMDSLIVLLSFFGYGLIGFIDDYLIVVKQNNDGLSARSKFMMQLVWAAIFYMMYRNYTDFSIALPFSSHSWHLGAWYSILILIMFSGSSNAVNLTDGMDGLAAGCSLIAFIPFLIFAYNAQQVALVTFIASLIGSLLAYLHFNKKPAQIFMGDTGALALGGVLAALAMVLGKEIALILVGGIFVVETLCVMIQIGSVKIRHKRVFPYTPIHYTFVIKGMKERQVVNMFYLVELAFALIGLWVGLH